MKKYIQHQAPVLPVKNVFKALEFYRDVLKFDLAWVLEDTYGSVYNGNIEVHFTKSDKVEVQTLYFFVRNADQVYQFLKTQKVDFIEEIQSKSWGMREFVIRDLDGHRLRIGHGERNKHEIEVLSREIG
ncbi:MULTISPECIES: VOC family protein [Paenibacillus]|uniref:VOC family protein n=1 Tax=Paenibacillus TaxID=44249 RepID=UPI00020D71FB|nr:MULTISPECIES: VOC family protein [Paenibacillus]EGL18769.1 glyoxalase family protein [Paenibacillus sp. HGF7]EPD92740.1 hypothetical protein HMPREF1207_00511 [Paenibacillus sp. HGH0039]MBV6713142.1 VOC family protein [Paenibacillus chitinolyticus]